MKKTTKQKALEDALELLSAACGSKAQITLDEFQKPPRPDWGDISFPCFTLSKLFKTDPASTASRLSEIINEQLASVRKRTLIRKTQNQGGYLNFFIDTKRFSELLFKRIEETSEAYGNSDLSKGQRAVVEYSSPNINKPLTLGHIRNICIGWSVAELLKTQGWKVFKTEIRNDRGAAMCKTMLAWKKWSHGATPKSEGKKGDHFIGEYYVLFQQKLKDDETLKNEIHECLQKWETRDWKTRKIWKKIRHWVVQGIEKTYRTLGADFHKVFYESDIYQQGASLVKKAFQEKKLQRDEKGNIVANLDEYKLPPAVLLRADSTSVYITQDLFLAQEKYKSFKFDISIHVVASEQDLYFKKLFAIFNLLGLPWAKKSIHLSYGLINLPTGKMKSREGTAVDADTLIEEMQQTAKEEIIKRNTEITEKELQKRSMMIALAAIKYFILQVDLKTLMVFDPKKSISLQGRTGPYLQYMAVRMQSILKKADKKYKKGPIEYALFNTPEEHELIMSIADFPEVLSQAAGHYNPSLLAKYLYEVAKTFSSLYEKHTIIDEIHPEITKARVCLVQHTFLVLTKGIRLLGMEVPERM